MAQMNVGMSLTLADGASGPLRAFVSLMEQLGVVASGVAAKLTSVAQGITGINSAASGASAVTALSGALGALSTEATGARTATTGLEASLGALGASLTAVTAQLGATLAGMAALGAQATATGAQMNAGAANMGAGLGAANTQASSLLTTLKGLAEVYVGLKIEKGLKASAEDAIEFQNTQTRLKNMNVGAAGQASLMAAASATSQAVPQFSQNQALEMGIDLRNATGSVEQALKMLTPFAVAAYDMKMATPKGQTFDDRDMLLIAKSLEQRNATMDPVKMQSELDMITKIYAATQGRVDAQQILGNLQYAKGGLGQSMDISFLPIMAAMIEQTKSGGGSGGQIGTALTTLQQSVLTGVGNSQAQKERARLGLLDPDSLVWNRQGQIDRQKSNLSMAGSDEFQRNPYEWVQNYLKPAMVRAGIDLADDAAVNATLNKLFPNRNAAQAVSMMVNRGDLIEKDAANINQTADSREQYQNNVATAQANIDAFKAQMTNLGIVLGTTLLPAITAVAKAFTEMFESLAAFFAEHPIAAQIATWGAALAGVAITVAGFAALFSGLGLGALFSGIASVAVSAFGLIVGAIEAVIAVLGGPLTIIIGLVLLAWQAGFLDWIAKINVFGRTIGDWAEALSDTVVNAFQNMWVRTKAFFGFISEDAAKAQIAANNARGAQTGAASGHWEEDPFAGPVDMGKGDGWGGKKPGSGLFRPSSGTAASGTRRGRTSTYNPDADFAANAYKVEQDDLRQNMKVLDAIYKSGTLSVENYYIDKQAALEVAVEAELRTLAKERAAYIQAGNMAGVNRVDTQMTAAQNRLASGTDENEANKKREFAKLDKDAVDLQRQLLQTSGQRHQAELLHLQEEMKAKTDILVLNKRITQEEADAMLARAQAASEYADQSRQIVQLQEIYASKTSALNDAERNSTLSQTAAEDQKFALRKQEAAQLDDLIAKLRVLAVAAGDEKALLELDKLSTRNNTAKNELPADQVTVLKSAQTGFENFFKTIINGTKGLKGAFKDLGQSIADSINQVVAKRLGDALFDSLFSAFFGGKGGAGSAGLGSLFSAGSSSGGGLGGWLGSLFGSSGGIGAGTVGGSNVSEAGIALGSFASGIDNVPSDMLAVIHKGERVMTAADNANYTPMQQGKTQINHINISPPAGMSRQSANQLGADISRQLQLADRRNN